MVKKILKMKNQIASVQELRVKDKNDVVTRRLNIFVELCIRLYCKEHDTQCIVLFVTSQVKPFMALCASGSL